MRTAISPASAVGRTVEGVYVSYDNVAIVSVSGDAFFAWEATAAHNYDGDIDVALEELKNAWDHSNALIESGVATEADRDAYNAAERARLAALREVGERERLANDRTTYEALRLRFGGA